jgi:hypothetical protein
MLPSYQDRLLHQRVKMQTEETDAHSLPSRHKRRILVMGDGQRRIVQGFPQHGAYIWPNGVWSW